MSGFEVLARWHPGHRVPGLTARRSDVMRLLNAGQSVQEIARQLDLGVGTGKPISPGPIALWARDWTEALLRSRLVVDGAASKVLR